MAHKGFTANPPSCRYSRESSPFIIGSPQLACFLFSYAGHQQITLVIIVSEPSEKTDQVGSGFKIINQPNIITAADGSSKPDIMPAKNICGKIPVFHRMIGIIIFLVTVTGKKRKIIFSD